MGHFVLFLQQNMISYREKEYSEDRPSLERWRRQSIRVWSWMTWMWLILSFNYVTLGKSQSILFILICNMLAKSLLCFLYRELWGIDVCAKACKWQETMQMPLLISIRGPFHLPMQMFICQCANLLDGILPVHSHSLKQSSSSRILIWASE